MRLWLDLETYSDVPLSHGTHAYAAAAEILLFAYAIDDAPAVVWDVTRNGPMPGDLGMLLIDDSVELWAHNSHFDRTVLRHTLRHLPASRWRDTMVQALAHSLPGSLSDLCHLLGVPTDRAKDKDGRRLVHLFCKPLPRGRTLQRAYSSTYPAEWARFMEYARLDVEAMREVHRRLPTWNYPASAELALWHLDQRINDRGFAVDADLAHAAIRAVEREQAVLAKETAARTDGELESTRQRDAMLAHLLSAYGVALPDLQKSTLERRVKDENLPLELRELLAIRLQASGTSTSKYRALLNGMNDDGRLRGTLQFCGANRTGRWSGRTFQPQNLPRPKLKPAEVERGVEALLADCADLVTDDVMGLTSSAIRACIVAPPGRKLVVADYSNIEGRVLAWLAGETWKLDAFRAFDAGTGPDLYKLAYAKSFNIRHQDVTKDQRQIGKVQELALGYEGGVGAFVTFAAAYGLDLEALGAQAYDTLPVRLLDQAKDALQWARETKRPRYGLSDRAWLVCETFKRAWRTGHPRVASFWRDLKDAAIAAVCMPGRVLECRGLRLRRDRAWLRIRLPSGRYLCYPAPRINDDGALSYMGVNQYSGKWTRLVTYGGKLAENVTQAVARDLLAASMPTVEDAGYMIVLTVHDEILTEVPDSPEFNARHLSEAMCRLPTWAAGLPIAATGYEDSRYRKD